MKKIELEILKFGVEDVIATSAAPAPAEQFMPVNNDQSSDSEL